MDDLLWDATHDLVASLESTVADGFYRAALLHWFNPTLLKAVNGSGKLEHLGPPRPRKADPRELDAAIAKLPFVEEYLGKGHNVHSRTRRIVLDHLWHDERDFYRNISAQADRYFSRLIGRSGSSAEDIVEAFYHRLAVDEDAGIDFGVQLFDVAVQVSDAALGHALASALEERSGLGHVSRTHGWFSRLWRARLARAAERRDEVVTIAQEILDAPADEVTPAMRSYAASLAGNATAAAGAYADALSWYRRAEEHAEGLDELVEIRLQVATARQMQNRYADAERQLREVLNQYVPTLLVPLTSVQGQFGPAEIKSVLVPAGWDPQPEDLPPHEARFRPRSVFADEPDAWAPTPGGFAVFVRGRDGGRGGLGALRDRLWPVEPTEVLAEIWRSLASVYIEIGELATGGACAEIAVNVSRAVGDEDGVILGVQLVYVAGGMSTNVRLLEWAIDEHERALENATRNGNRGRQIAALHWLGNTHLDTHHYELAAEKLTRARDLAAATNSLVDQARALDGLGFGEWVAGSDDRALAFFEEGLALLRRGGYLRDEAEMLLRIGNLHLTRRRPVQARELMGRALARYRELGVPIGEIDALQALARVAVDRHTYDEARALLSDALKIARSIGVSKTEAMVLSDLAGVEAERGRPMAARDRFNLAIRIARRGGDTELEADLIQRKADAALSRHRWRDAERLYRQALALYREVRRPRGEALGLLGLHNVAEERGDFKEAAALGEQVLRLARKIHDRDLERAGMVALSVAYSDLGRHADAAQMLEEVVRLDPEDAGALVNLGWILYQAGEFEQSIVESKRALGIDPAQTYALRNLGHAHLALGRDEEADFWYSRAVDERHEGEDFVVTITVLRKLLREHPDLPRVQEFLDRFVGVQAKIAAELASSDAARV